MREVEGKVAQALKEHQPGARFTTFGFIERA